MERSLLTIRGHHLLCMFGFRGLGYSPPFIENMRRVVHEFFASEPVVVRLTRSCDDICRACPHMHGGECTRSQDSGVALAARDAAVLEVLALTPGTEHSNAALRGLVRERITASELRHLCAGSATAKRA